MKNSILLFVLFFSLNLSAQFSSIKDKLEGFEIPEGILTENLNDSDAKYYFDVKSTTVTSSGKSIEVSHFDPALPAGSRWVLDQVNGKQPTPKNLEDFDKTNNTKQGSLNGIVDAESWKLVRDDDTYILVEFRYEKESLPKKYTFLGDCNGLAYFNKQSKFLEKTEFLNTAPLTIKSLQVSNFDMVVNYSWDASQDTYFVTHEELIMAVDNSGQIEVVKETNEFSNYSKL